MVSDGLDVEAKCGTNDARIFAIDLQHDRRLSRIVETSLIKEGTKQTKSYKTEIGNGKWSRGIKLLHHENSHFFLFLLDLSDYTEQTHFRV